MFPNYPACVLYYSLKMLHAGKMMSKIAFVEIFPASLLFLVSFLEGRHESSSRSKLPLVVHDICTRPVIDNLSVASLVDKCACLAT